MKNVSFNFGKNWSEYSNKVFDENKFVEAKKSLRELLGVENLESKSFLDIGCGSGIFSLAAVDLGAESVTGWDISNESIQTSRENSKMLNVSNVEFIQKDILNEENRSLEQYDIVYSWGVLHHTGNMWKAISNAMNFVKNEGLFVIAIYNTHWSSKLWQFIKWFYNFAPGLIKKVMVYFFYMIILFAKLLVTRSNPFTKKRGMNFYYDVVDWIGGYPYEYASKKDIEEFFINKKFKLNKFVKSAVPTGCNEFVFIRE